MALRIIIGLALTVVALTIAGRRLWWLYRIGRTGQPAPERIEAVRQHPARDAEVRPPKCSAQRKLLQWTVPGIAHFVTFWGFIILILTLIESYGDLFSRSLRDPRHRALGVDRVPGGPPRGRRSWPASSRSR